MERAREEVFRVYMTDYLQVLGGGGNGKRYYDVIHGKVDDRTAEEIIIQTIDKAGLVIG